MTKKFNLKFPSMIAITLFGAAFTSQHAHAAEANQNSNNTNNVIDDQQNIENAEQAKKEVTNSAQNVSGVQTYQNPSDVKASVATVSKTYDAKLDNLTSTTQTQDQQSTQNQSIANTNATNSNSELANVKDSKQEVSSSNKSDQKLISITHKVILMLIRKHCKLLKTLYHHLKFSQIMIRLLIVIKTLHKMLIIKLMKVALTHNKRIV